MEEKTSNVISKLDVPGNQAPRPLSGAQDEKCRLMYYLHILLHQMCYAFLILYSCRANHCDKHPNATGYNGQGKVSDCSTGKHVKCVGSDLEVHIESAKKRHETVDFTIYTNLTGRPYGGRKVLFSAKLS